MKPLPHIKTMGLLVLFSLSLLAGCGPSAEQIAAQTAAAQTSIAALWTATPTETAVPTGTATPTVTPSPVPTRTPTQMLTPEPTTATGPLTRFTLQDVTFSIAVPEGWTQSENASSVILSGPTMDGMQLILSFSLDQHSLFGAPLEADGEIGIPLFSAYVQDKIAEMSPNLKPISEEFLQTPGGEPYFRWAMEHNPRGQALHQVFYIFGSGKWFLTAMYGRPASAGAEWDEQIDAAMKTLTFVE